jgi:hypothetical protein
MYAIRLAARVLGLVRGERSLTGTTTLLSDLVDVRAFQPEPIASR